MDSAFSATDLVIPPPEEAWVERLPDGDMAIRWQRPAERVAVYVDGDPDMTAGGRFLVAESGLGTELRVTSAELAATVGEARPYFLVELDGRRHIIAERALPLVNGVNFRDLGGYRTAGGQVVRWGRAFRAGSLAELTGDDLDYLARLGLRLSCDLRSPEEIDRNPDRLSTGAVAMYRPITAETNRLHRVITLFRKRHRIQELLLDVYTIMLDQNGAIFADIIRAAAEPDNLPMVVHCTAGKDRTGLATAILLLALGVPEETVIADYTLSNRAFDVLAGRMRPEMERLYAFGFGEVQVRPFLLAEARTMAGALAYLRRRYGSVEWYLLRAGVEDEAIERLRATLLLTG